jgi:hypothetical protein
LRGGLYVAWRCLRSLSSLASGRCSAAECNWRQYGSHERHHRALLAPKWRIKCATFQSSGFSARHSARESFSPSNTCCVLVGSLRTVFLRDVHRLEARPKSQLIRRALAKWPHGVSASCRLVLRCRQWSSLRKSGGPTLFDLFLKGERDNAHNSNSGFTVLPRCYALHTQRSRYTERARAGSFF